MAFLNEAGVSRLWQHILAKLNLKADKTDVKQADWKQSDTTQMDYIKNRPFYKDETVTPGVVLIDTLTAAGVLDNSLDTGSYKISLPVITNFPNNEYPETLKITFDGEEYEVYADSSPSIWSDATYYGNPKLVSDGFLPMYEEPFFFCPGFNEFYVEDSAQHTIKIEIPETVGSEVVKLPLEFLPDHTHTYAGSTTAGGAANSVKSSLTVKLNGGNTEGTNKFTFNGSSAKTINITPESIGANSVYVGPEEPTDSNVDVWIDTDANADTPEEWRASLDVYSKAEVDEVIDNIQVGGRNLLRGTRDWDSAYWSYIGNHTVSGETVLVDAAGLGENEYKQTYQQIDLQAGKTYTLSVDLLEAQPGLVGVWATDNTQMKRHYAINLPAGTASEVKRYSGTFTVPEGSARFVIYVQARNGGYIKVQHIQLEEGNKATAWSPSPEDIKKESRAYNLLDNSDFTNVINQRGLTHYTSGKYTVDRWQAMAGITDVEVVDGGVKVTGGEADGSHCWWGQPFEKALDTNKTYTIYVELTDGNVYTAIRKPDNVIFALNSRVHARLSTSNLQLISLNGQAGTTYKYIALYEGAYTAQTCPIYIPKGYAHELAECQRYYENSWYGGNKARQSQMQGFVASTNIDTYVFFKQPKRIQPTITLHPYNNYGHWAYFKGAYYEAAAETVIMRDGNIGFMARLTQNSSAPTTLYYSYAVEGHWEASAEL